MKVVFKAKVRDCIVIALKGRELKLNLKNCSNAIGALIENRLLIVGVFDCSVNTEVFECWIEQDLLPKRKETSGLIMDNATFHKGKRLQELIRCAVHYIVWLSKYSLNLDPIEKNVVSSKNDSQ
jgi:transposase